MGIHELKCPHCGASVNPDAIKRLFKCDNCGSTLEYDDGIVRTYHETRHIDEAEIYRQKVELEKLKDQERKDNFVLKRTALRALGPVLVVLFIILFFVMRISPGSQYDYRGKNYTTVKNMLSSAGFWNITCIPVENIGAAEANKDGKVYQVLFNGDDNTWRKVFRWAKVEVYYHKMPNNPPVNPPFDSGSNFNGWKLQDAVDKLYSVGFAEIYGRAEYDLDSVSDGNRGKVFNVTIAGETEWAKNKIRKTYHRDDEVIIYYHDAKATAQASPPEGNSSLVKGQNYELIKARFEEAGFTNISLKPGNYGLPEGNVVEVTVDGETEWSYGIGGMLRKTYIRTVPVIIRYSSH